tara:strand:+ start:12002 stop:12967 length:966 start_codon:yes stop_codon:yes gene_type:complete
MLQSMLIGYPHELPRLNKPNALKLCLHHQVRTNVKDHSLLKSFAHADLLKADLADQVRRALGEDIGGGDITAALIGAETTAHAVVITRDDGVFCGAPWVDAVCAAMDTQIESTLHAHDGADVAANQVLFEINGDARALVTLERTLLNFVQLLCGTATTTRRFANLIDSLPTRLLDTRKTVPGLRLAQKYAVHCGGGHNHRLGLFDAYLIKENHLSAAGGIACAVRSARRAHPELTVEVEVESLDELQAAIAAGAQIALLDNFSLEDTRRAVELADGRIELEASGDITEETIAEIAATGVDYISSGAITKQVMPLDLSMRFS